MDKNTSETPPYLAGVIGHPISHSKSPKLHNYWLSKYKINGFYVPFSVTTDKLQDSIKSLISLGFNGVNVTIPHKEKILPFLESVDVSADEIGAVNCVAKLKGYNTDWIGFKKAMDENSIKLKNKNCIIFGAGGAARAVAYALIKSECNSITILNRSENRKQTICKWIDRFGNFNANLNEADIIINCTPVGMWPNQNDLPVYNGKISSNQVVVDTIYNPYETAFLNYAKKAGAKVINGIDMFILQGLASINIWEKKDITQKVNFKKIKKVLKAKLC